MGVAYGVKQHGRMIGWNLTPEKEGDIGCRSLIWVRDAMNAEKFGSADSAAKFIEEHHIANGGVFAFQPSDFGGAPDGGIGMRVAA